MAQSIQREPAFLRCKQVETRTELLRSTIIDRFRAAFTARDIVPPAQIIENSNIHRCDAAGKNGKGDAASRAVNASLTLRNWAIGCYIVEYEQNGADRANYGTCLLKTLSDALTTRGVEDMAARSLRLYRQFFLTYENIWQALPAKSASALLPASIWQTLSAKLRPQRPERILLRGKESSSVRLARLRRCVSLRSTDPLSMTDECFSFRRSPRSLLESRNIQQFDTMKSLQHWPTSPMWHTQYLVAKQRKRLNSCAIGVRRQLSSTKANV